MMSVEHLHLKHVLQTVCALEAVILRSFGPEGGKVLFTRSTGQAMLSCSGMQILKALHLEHPLARMVVECVWKHSSVTGDGSKTFVLLLASLLRMIHASASKAPIVSEWYTFTEAATARHLADKLLVFATTELDVLISVSVVPHGLCVSSEDFTTKTQLPACRNHFRLQSLLSSFFHTRLDYMHCDFFSDLACELLSHWKLKNDKLSFFLQFLNENFPPLHTQVSGFPVSSSRLIEGQVIHRDFSTSCLQVNKQPVKAVVFTGYLQPKILSQGYVLELGCDSGVTGEKSIMPFSAWTERSLESIIATLQSFGVSVLLCAVKQSAAVLALAAKAEMCLVECVSEEELSLFVQLSGVTPISDCWKIQPENVATLTFCRAILLGAHRYVHVAFSDSGVKPCSLVICAPGEAQTSQYTSAFQDAIRMLLTTWEPLCVTEATALMNRVQTHKCSSLHAHNLTDDTANISDMCVLKPGCVIPAGGTFEFLLHHSLIHDRTCSASNCTNLGGHVSQILASTLLSVPRQIYSHNPKRFLQAQTWVTSLVSNQSHPSMALKNAQNTTEDHERGDTPSKFVMLDMGLESISCKYQLLLAVLQCATSLLRVNAVVQTHTALHSPSHRLTNISEGSTDDETED